MSWELKFNVSWKLIGSTFLIISLCSSLHWWSDVNWGMRWDERGGWEGWMEIEKTKPSHVRHHPYSLLASHSRPGVMSFNQWQSEHCSSADGSIFNGKIEKTKRGHVRHLTLSSSYNTFQGRERIPSIEKEKISTCTMNIWPLIEIHHSTSTTHCTTDRHKNSIQSLKIGWISGKTLTHVTLLLLKMEWLHMIPVWRICALCLQCFCESTHIER